MYVKDKQNAKQVEKEPNTNPFRQELKLKRGNNREFIVSLNPGAKTVQREERGMFIGENEIRKGNDRNELKAQLDVRLEF